MRTEAQKGALGNQLTQLMAPLPVFLDDPLARLRYVKDAMDGLKESRRLLAASAIASLQGFAPPTLHAQASRMNFSGRFFNLLVTNVPGPQFPLYVLGRKLSEIFPIPFLAGERALAIAIMSYDGKVGFGLLGDYDALPDLDVVAEGIEASLAQLVALAGRAPRPPRLSRVSFQRGIDGAEPVRPDPVGGTAETHDYRRRLNAGRLGTGTLACPRCDAPVALAPGPAAVGAALALPVLPSRRGRARLPLARRARAAGARRDPRRARSPRR